MNSESNEFDPEEAKFEHLMTSLMKENRMRYEKQAVELLLTKHLTVNSGVSILRYKIENHGCTTDLSTDAGQYFRNLGWRRLEFDDGKDIPRLIWEFAESEAREILER